MSAMALNIKSTGTTSTRPASGSSIAGLAPAPAVTTQDDDHQRGLKRWFLGPMPEKVATTRVETRKQSFIARHGSLRIHRRRTEQDGDDGDAESDGASIVTDDAGDVFGHVKSEQLYRYFKRKGGNDEDWNDQTKQGLRMEIKRKWQESPWHHVWRPEAKKKKNASNKKWVGESFLVGSVLGVGSDNGPTSAYGSVVSLGHSESPRATPTSRGMKTSIPEVQIDTSESTGSDDRYSPQQFGTSKEALIAPLPFRSEPVTSDVHRAAQVPLPPIGADELEPVPPANLRPALKPDGGQPTPRRKSVNFEGHMNTEGPPAPPEIVLARTEGAVEETSAVGVVAQSRETKEVILQDRMLVKISYFETDGLTHPFDEEAARRYPNPEKTEWAEYLVCWRKRHLELYEEWDVPGAKLFTHSKHLAYMVSLRKPRAHISLYSRVDSSFCITCPPIPLNLNATSASDKSSRRSIVRSSPRDGTYAFVFKCKSRSRAADWMWHIWREIGGGMPDVIEVNVPQLGSRIRFDVPSAEFLEVNQGYRTISRRYILDMCRQYIGPEDWEKILDDAGQVELCWRKNGNLEWIWLDLDVNGETRAWSVVHPVGFRQLKAPMQLEVRPARHAATKVVLNDGTKLSEPPSVEGYLYRIKANTQTRTQIYVSSHDGNLFTLSPANSYAPAPPEPPIVLIDKDAKTDEDKRTAELRRGAQQIFHSDGYIDLRSIMAVRRATQATVPRFALQDSGNIQDVNLLQSDDESHPPEPEHPSLSDAEDTGGDEFLNTHPNKQRLKLKRSFDLTLRTGHVIRFETHSCVVAVQWVSRLRALISYWTRRHRVDARQEMDLTHAIRGRPKWGSSEIILDATADHPHIEQFWSWCVLEGCRPIIKAGRLYEKRGPHKQFKHMFHVLTHGCIVQYFLKPTKSAHFNRSRAINLLDAYVYSGQLAISSLPQGSAQPSQAAPKRYQDGLEADDDDEDVTFIIWYRPHSSGPLVNEKTTGGQHTTIPPLDGKHKILVCKARSILERDSWCFALNAEIERLSRRTSSREKDIQELGGIA
ncbi:hypothetical protein FRB95_011008 [Tulasnella sp. JGI-2019a]|nr:hypothetical protein FRB95_011008 [Tulasnella sp. JGI-2019a]